MRVKSMFFVIFLSGIFAFLLSAGLLDFFLLKTDPVLPVILARLGVMIVLYTVYFMLILKKYRWFLVDYSSIQDESDVGYRESLIGLGRVPLSSLALFFVFSLVGIGITAFLQERFFGAGRFSVLLLGLLCISLALYFAAFIFVLLDRLIMRLLLEQKVTKYPDGLLIGRQKRKNVIIPLFMSIMAFIVSFTLTMVAAGNGLKLENQSLMAFIKTAGGFVTIIGLAYHLLVAGLVVVWSRNTSSLYDLLLDKLAQISSLEKDLTGRVPIASIDELSTMVGYINKFNRMLENDIGEIGTAYGTFGGIQAQLLQAVASATQSTGDIADRIDSLEILIEREDTSVSGAMNVGSTLSINLQNLVSTMHEQNTGLKNTVILVEGTIAAVQDAAVRTKSVKEKVQEMRDTFDLGGKEIRETLESVSAVAGLSKKLSGINSVIAKIASQTNLLAMNAAIEAAHAGEAGAGFSVVADEIRSLAESTAKQTKESRDNLAAVVKEVEKAVMVSGRTAETYSLMRDVLVEVGEHTEAVAVNMQKQDGINAEVLTAIRKSSDVVEAGELLTIKLEKDAESLTSSLSILGNDAQNTGENSRAIRVQNDTVRKSIESLAEFAKQSAELNEHIAKLIHGFKV